VAEAERDELKQRLEANQRQEERLQQLVREKLVQRHTRQLRTEMEKLNNRLARVTEGLQAEIAKRDREIEQQKQQLHQLQQVEAEVEQRGRKIDEQEQQLQRLRKEIGERDQRIEQQKRQLQQLRAQIQERARAAEADAAKGRHQGEQRMGTVQQLRLPATASFRDAPKGEDDLKRIRGIGPRFERAPKENGIGRYQQIATWGPAEIEEIAGKIGVNAKRIVRDKWVQRARELEAQRGQLLQQV
jgi:predicted flap endonuclease-1-like 5' DNA nuclease